MQIVKLANNKTVELIISMGSVMRIKSVLNHNLLDVGKEGCIEKILDDQVELCNVLYLLCEKSCEAKSITDLDFGYGMEGDKLQLATDQFLEELKNFLPPYKKTLLSHSLKTMAEIQKTILDASIKKLDEMKVGMTEIVKNEMDKRLTLESLKDSLSEQK